MKLITAIISKDDVLSVRQGLADAGFYATRLATTGSFLGKGNVTFLIGTDDDKVDTVIDIIREHCRERRTIIPTATGFDVGGYPESCPVEVTVGGATVFVQNIERFEKL